MKDSVDQYIPARPKTSSALMPPSIFSSPSYFQQAYQAGKANLESAGYTGSGQPYTGTSDDIIEHLSGQFQNTMKTLASTGYFGQVTPRESITPYYGDNTQQELEKARYYSNFMKGYTGINPVYREAYEKADVPVEVGVQQDPESQLQAHYTPSKNRAILNSPGFKYADPQELEQIKSRDADAIKMLKYNEQTPEELEFLVKNPWAAYYSQAEHEIGHSWTEGDENAPTSKGYMGERPNEIANALGRIQRETYAIHGKRFGSNSFVNYLTEQMGVDEEKRFKSYSPEARRGLRAIMDSYLRDTGVKGTLGNPKPDENVLWKQAAYAIPGFVQAKSERKDREA
jgi:hypothetical protein